MHSSRPTFVWLVFLGHAAVCSPSFPAESDAGRPMASERLLLLEDLRCEYLRNPVGIDTERPRLSWTLRSDARGQKQTAYQVLVASRLERLSKDTGDLWNSGRVATDQSIQVVYGGKPLASRTRCFWKVRVWDRDGRPSTWSDSASWSMGLLQPADWQAQWVRFGKHAAAAGTRSVQPSDAAVSPWIRKTFLLEAEPKQGTAYVNTLGYHELYVNGRKVGADVLSPAVSDYRARSFYVTYDITRLLHKGRNCVGLWLGRGWHVAGRPGVQATGPAVRFQGEIVTGGRTVTIQTDETWKCAPSSYATLGPWAWDQFGGERYDARLDNPAWCAADFDDGQWNSVEVAPPTGARSESQLCPLNRIGQRIPAVTCTDLGSGRYEVDFGTNLTGWLRMRLPQLAAGQRIVIRYADRRDTTAVRAHVPTERTAAPERRSYRGFRRQRFGIRPFIRPTSSFPPAGRTKNSAASSTITVSVTRLSKDCPASLPWAIWKHC